MPQPNENPQPENNEPDPPKDPPKDPDRYVMSRDEAKALFAMRDEVKELRTFRSEREAADKAAEEAALLQEKEYQKLLENKDAELAAKIQEIEKRDAADAKRAKQAQRSKLLDAVEKESNLSGKRAVLDGLLSVIERDGFDAAPEDITKSIVGDVLKRMQGLDGDTFKPKDIGVKGAPGGNSPDPGTELSERQKAIIAEAQRLSPRRRAG